MRYRYSTTSPFVRKTSVFLIHHGLWHKLELVPTLTTSVNTEPEREEDIPLGKIPALEISEGEWLYDSRVICRYVDEHSVQPTLYPKDESQWFILKMEALADGMVDNLVPVVYENLFREDGLVWHELHHVLKRRVCKALTYAEENFNALGNELNAASIALVSVVSWLMFRQQTIGIDPAQYAPNLVDWVQMMEEKHAEFKQTRPALS